MRLILLSVVCAAALAGLTACHEEGRGERAGKSLDKAGQNISDTLNPPKGPAQSAGRKLDRALGD